MHRWNVDDIMGAMLPHHARSLYHSAQFHGMGQAQSGWVCHGHPGEAVLGCLLAGVFVGLCIEHGKTLRTVICRTAQLDCSKVAEDGINMYQRW